MKEGIWLYTVENNVKCLECGNKGAIQEYGKYFANGVGELAAEVKAYENVRNKPYMSRAMGFGGTIPHKCLNCGNYGLIDYGGLEGYKQAFESIKEPLKVIDGGRQKQHSDVKGK
ncbi:hypothetical protein P4679_22625 [Priestia megaterium]|uniref:hypothetical protein n=1 Tax=Priestia megaterium TaxID=1404 RepID=UPI002E20351C|nr:hypothetical protein [Priestia megaterium]